MTEVAGSDTPDQLRERAAAALQTHRAQRAKQLYETILARDPEDADALAGLGEAEMLLRNHEDALDHSLKAVALAGERPDVAARARHTAGLVLLLSDRIEEAEKQLDMAAALDPGSWRTWNAHGRARDARGAWPEAQAAYSRALTLAADEGVVLNNLALSKLSAGDLDEASTLFVRALQASPDLPAAETNLRLSLALSGRYDEALAGVADQDMPEALNNAGYAALLRGDYPQARILLVQAIDASPSFYEPAWSNLRFLSSVEKRQALAQATP